MKCPFLRLGKDFANDDSRKRLRRTDHFRGGQFDYEMGTYGYGHNPISVDHIQHAYASDDFQFGAADTAANQYAQNNYREGYNDAANQYQQQQGAQANLFGQYLQGAINQYNAKQDQRDTLDKALLNTELQQGNAAGHGLASSLTEKDEKTVFNRFLARQYLKRQEQLGRNQAASQYADEYRQRWSRSIQGTI